MRLREFAPSGGGGSGDYLRALASAWYNGTFDTGSLQKGIKSQEDVERLLNRGIVCPDGKTRKLHIDYNSDFDGVEIYSDDYYEHGDESGELDSRTGQPWGPYDHMEFKDEELDESAKWRDPKYKDQLYTQEKPDYNDTREYDRARWDPKPKGYKGRKEPMAGGEFPRTDPLVKGFGRYGVGEPVSKGPRKGLPSRDQITSLKGSIKDAHGKHHKPNLPEQGMAEGLTGLSIQQLATISDEALDNAYHYGRSQPGNTFGWQANLKSAAYAKQMIDKGVTDIEAISDAIHKGWNVTAQAFVKNPDQFSDTEKLKAAGKLEAKLQQRAQLMKQNYAQLPEEEKEKDRVVARALLQAIKGEQGVAEGDLNEKSTSQAQFRTMAAAAHNPEFARKVGIKQSVAKEFNRADRGQSYKSLPKKAN